MHKLVISAASLIAVSVGSAFAGNDGIPRPAPYGQPPAKNELRLPPPPATPPAPANSGYIRPFTTGDGGIGAVGGYQRGNTSVNGQVYVPPSGSPSGNVTVTHNPLPPPARSAEPSVNLDTNKR
jgi:hypothetical protein